MSDLDDLWERPPYRSVLAFGKTRESILARWRDLHPTDPLPSEEEIERIQHQQRAQLIFATLWRPIETAPMIQRVLVLCRSGVVGIARRQWRADGEAVWISDDGDVDDESDPWTDWMPLPEATARRMNREVLGLNRLDVIESSGCVFADLNVACQIPACSICGDRNGTGSGDIDEPADQNR